MLIFAKAAYDCAIYFNTSYGEIIIYATLGLILFGAFAPLASYLSKVFSRKILLIVFPIGVGFSSIFAGFFTESNSFGYNTYINWYFCFDLSSCRNSYANEK